MGVACDLAGPVHADAKTNAQTTLDGLETKLESVKGQVERAVEDSGASEGGKAP